MKKYLPLEPVIHYLLDTLKIKPAHFPECEKTIWPILFNYAKTQKIDLYLAAFCLSQWPNHIPNDVKLQLKKSLIVNKTRNTLLSKQIVTLSQLFKNAEIPLMFIKGSAGIIRGLYPLELRYSSDIDVLVPIDYVDKSRDLLKSNGYIPELNHNVPDHHHHIEPYSHEETMGSIEIHIEPYDHSILESPTMPDIWNDAETILFKGEKTTVPSISDHTWILLRTSGSGMMFLPRLAETIEMSFVISNNYTINFDLLKKRGEKDYIPNLLTGMAYACSKYLGITPFAYVNEPLMKHWECWSLAVQHKMLKNMSFKASRKRFGLIIFLPGKGITPKIQLLRRLIRYEILEDFHEQKISKGKSKFIKLWRIIKNVLTYSIFYCEYIVYKFRMKLQQNSC